jgi:hypothetical protein
MKVNECLVFFSSFLTIYNFISESSYKVKTKWIKADFSEGKPAITHIQKELSNIPNIGILGT